MLTIFFGTNKVCPALCPPPAPPPRPLALAHALRWRCTGKGNLKPVGLLLGKTEYTLFSDFKVPIYMSFNVNVGLFGAAATPQRQRRACTMNNDKPLRQVRMPRCVFFCTLHSN